MARFIRAIHVFRQFGYAVAVGISLGIEMVNELVDFWARSDLSGPQFVHPDDQSALGAYGGRYLHNVTADFESYIRSEHFGKRDSRFHTSLLPVPYGGDLSRADIFILLLNPGFSHADYFGELHMPAFRKRLEKNLTQNFENEEFPFLSLDPKFSWYGGFLWWERKLRDVIAQVAKDSFDGRYLDSLRHISTRLAHIQLVPYHSSHFGDYKLIGQLKSSEIAKRYVSEVLMPDVRRGAKTIVVTRQAASWDLGKEGGNCVIYGGHQARGASLGPNTSGGKAILSQLRRPPVAA